SLLHITVLKNNKPLINSLNAGLVLSDKTLPGRKSKVLKAQKQKFNTIIHPVVAIKNSSIKDEYNQLTLTYKDHFAVVFRLYDDAFAYRFETSIPDSITVNNEICDISIPGDTEGWFAFADRWMNSYEHMYEKSAINKIDNEKTAQLPFLLSVGDTQKLLITESDLYDYPGLYFAGNTNDHLHAIFPPVVKSEKENKPGWGGWDRIFVPASTYDYISRTSGRRSFPWRIFAIANNDRYLLNNDI